MTPPPFPQPGYDLEKGFPGMPRFPSQARFSSRSSSSSFSALPHIGCLPDANYSGEELGEVVSGDRRSKKSVGRSRAGSKR